MASPMLTAALALVALFGLAQATSVEDVLVQLKAISALRRDATARVERSSASAAEGRRTLLQTTFAANEYSKCIFQDGSCSVNYLYLATAEFGASPSNSVQDLFLGYAYQAKQCAAKNGDAAGCNAISTCTYRSSSSLCQWQSVADLQSFFPSCSGAKISLDAIENLATCALLTSNESGCKANANCTFANSACSSKADLNALTAFVAYVTMGTGSWDDSWFGTCDIGKLFKSVYTTCHGTTASSCPTDKCEFDTTCNPKPTFATSIALGDNTFATKFTAADTACDAKTTRDTCEAEKGPAPTTDLSKYNDVSKLQADLKSGSGAQGLARSALLMFVAAAAGLLAMVL